MADQQHPSTMDKLKEAVGGIADKLSGYVQQIEDGAKERLHKMDDFLKQQAESLGNGGKSAGAPTDGLAMITHRKDALDAAISRAEGASEAELQRPASTPSSKDPATGIDFFKR